MVGFQTNGDDTQQSRKDWKQHMHAARREGCLRARPLREFCFDRRPRVHANPFTPPLSNFPEQKRGGGCCFGPASKVAKMRRTKEKLCICRKRYVAMVLLNLSPKEKPLKQRKRAHYSACFVIFVANRGLPHLSPRKKAIMSLNCFRRACDFFLFFPCELAASVS